MKSKERFGEFIHFLEGMTFWQLSRKQSRHLSPVYTCSFDVFVLDCGACAVKPRYANLELISQSIRIVRSLGSRIWKSIAPVTQKFKSLEFLNFFFGLSLSNFLFFSNFSWVRSSFNESVVLTANVTDKVFTLSCFKGPSSWTPVIRAGSANWPRQDYWQYSWSHHLWSTYRPNLHPLGHKVIPKLMFWSRSCCCCCNVVPRGRDRFG